ncbi:MAG: MFS transporter [Cyclobacteriaceae bacterium]|nr:MFS transporter [Cyclobacteriaceae bacterium]
MIIPEMNNFITQLGGAAYKGFVISLFTLTALLSRPFSGKLADKVGRVPVMIFGSIVCFICSLIYPILTSVSGFLILRLAHGFSTGFTPTGQSAYLADIIPAEKRGEAMGLLGTAGSVGMALGPAFGGNIVQFFSLDVMFYCSSVCAIISVLILSGIKETLQVKNRFTPAMLKIERHEWFEPRVFAPCIVMVLGAFAYGSVFTVISDFGEFVGIKNKGLLFTYLTIASLVVRLLGGKASDRWGRKPVLRVSLSLIAISMVVIGLADTQLQLIIGVTLYGFAQGTTSPTLLAWATDLSDINHKGKGLASVYMAMELGIGFGALISAFIYDNDPSRFFITFFTCSVLSTLAFIYLVITGSKTKA